MCCGQTVWNKMDFYYLRWKFWYLTKSHSMLLPLLATSCPPSHHNNGVFSAIRDETVVCANKPCAATPSFPLCRQPNQHCCIFQKYTAGGERPKRSVQELFNLLWGWRRVISMIQPSYLGLCYAACKYIPSLSFSLSFTRHLSQSLRHFAVIAADRWRGDYYSSGRAHTYACADLTHHVARKHRERKQKYARTHTCTRIEVGRCVADNPQLQG